MADDENGDPIRPEFPRGRVKKIMKLDGDINKVNSEALFLISCSTQLFIEFLAEKSAQVATQKKRKTMRLEHMRVAVKGHRPTSDFLLDSLPLPSQPSDHPGAEQKKSKSQSQSVAAKPVPPGTRRIDDFFRNPES